MRRLLWPQVIPTNINSKSNNKLSGKVLGEKTLQLSWYNPASQIAGGNPAQEAAETEADGATPYQEDYLPPGLQEDETANETEEINEDLLDEEEEDVDERSWKRRNTEED